MLTPSFVCFLIYLRRHARYSEARRNALASDYVPALQRAVPYGRTSFRSASWNAFNPSSGSLSFRYTPARFPVAETLIEVRCESKLNSARSHASLLKPNAPTPTLQQADIPVLFLNSSHEYTASKTYSRRQQFRHATLKVRICFRSSWKIVIHLHSFLYSVAAEFLTG